MKASVVIPYRYADPDRHRNFAYIRSYWSTYFSDFEIIECDSCDDKFSRSKSRNQGIDRANGDFIIIADADTIVPVDSVVTSLLHLRHTEAPSWVIAYQWYYNLTEERTKEVVGELRQSPSIPQEGEYDHRLTAWAGMLVLPRGALEVVRYDERFTGWGGEDNAFQYAVDTLWGPFERVGSHAIHLWHPRGEDFASEDWPANQKLMNRYRMAAGKPQKMLQLVDGL